MVSSGQYLLAHEIKPSVQRLAIMDYLQTHKTHPSVDEIYNALLSSIPTLSKTTVYNTLKLFVDKGVASCLDIEEKNLRFDGVISDHAHFICLNCNIIFDLPLEKAPQATTQNTSDFVVLQTHIYHKGYCRKCLEKNN